MNRAKEKTRESRRRKPTKEEEEREQKRKSHYITLHLLTQRGSCF